jgi:hypothetical protein
MKGVLPWLVRWARRAGIRIIDFCPALAALVSPVQNIFRSPHTFSQSPSPSNLGRQSRRAAYLYVSGFHTHVYILSNSSTVFID